MEEFEFKAKAILPNGEFFYKTIKVSLGCYEEKEIKVEYKPNNNRMLINDDKALFGIKIATSEIPVYLNLTEYIKIQTDIESCSQYQELMMCSTLDCDETSRIEYLSKNPI